MISHNCTKNRAYKSNIRIHELGLAFDTFGNVSGRFQNKCLIKPSGVSVSELTEKKIVEVDISTSLFNGSNRPSTDTPTHIEIYRNFPEVGGICHVHSQYATAWAQAALPIPCFGTTHSDYWNGSIPITKNLSEKEIENEYEKNTGRVIINKIKKSKINPLFIPGVLVIKHGPFTWGKNIEEAVKNANLLESIAKTAWITLTINSKTKPISKFLREKHFNRKNGENSYYGQDSDC
jgi:L-ribulose-5-phosphate 4-epimerase